MLCTGILGAPGDSQPASRGRRGRGRGRSRPPQETWPPTRLPSYAELYPLPFTPSEPVLKPVNDPTGALSRDLEGSADALRLAAEARASPERDIVLLTTNLNQLDIGINLVANLASVGVHNYLILANSESTCTAISTKLACVWSSMMVPYQARLREARTNSVRALWLMRQIYLGRLARLRFNPMLLDADVILWRDPFRLIREHMPSYQAYFLGDSSAGYMSANGGTVYLRNAAPDGPVCNIWKTFERRVFALLNTSAPFPRQTMHKTRRGLIGGVPADALLYDQNVLDWSIIGEITGDRDYVGRGFSPEMRSLTPREFSKLAYTVTDATRPSPRQGSWPGGAFQHDYTLRVHDVGSPWGTRERIVKAPPWLFTAESDAYQLPHTERNLRVVGSAWGHQPSPTALVHFVCSVFPGSDGRRIAMRLLRRWFQADIHWVAQGIPLRHLRDSVSGGRASLAELSAAAPGTVGPVSNLPIPTDAADPRRFIVAFSAPLPLPGVKPATGVVPQKERIFAFHALIAAAAGHTGRRAVLPLFECKGILAEKSRFGWALHTPLGAAAPPGHRGASYRSACAYRVGVGCFHK